MADPVKLKDLFHIEYGNQFDKNKLIECQSGTNFVSRTSSNLGVDTNIEPIPGVEPYEEGMITATLGGTYLLSAFVQPAPFYTGQNIKVLRPLKPMSFNEKVYYCMAISQNRFRYTSHGREANKTFDDILVPPFSALPNWVNGVSIQLPEKAAFSDKYLALDFESWKDFRYDEIFEIKKGYFNKKPPACTADENELLPFIGASENNNGITSYHRLGDVAGYARGGEIDPGKALTKKIFPANSITVANNGASVGFAFFQPKPFTCSHDVNPLYLLGREITSAIGLFLCALIRMDRYRWSYGRKWRPSRMPNSTIKLPINAEGKPDWEFMEAYVKALPYSVSL